ncbi:MAG: DUF1844 domain-containing protein [Candidatus Omnitrophota bacterium]
MQEEKKNIDQSWKETVKKEKENLKQEGEFIPENPDFGFFVTTLALQAAISLGQMENPATNKKEENLPQAKFIIDTLSMLKEKTKGNLTAEEDQMLDNLLYELRTQYIAKNEGKIS